MEAQSKSICILQCSSEWWSGASDYLNFAVIDNTIPATPIWTHQRLSFTSFNISADANCPLPLPLLLLILSTHHHPSNFLGPDSLSPWNHIDFSPLLTKHCDKSSLLLFLSFFSLDTPVDSSFAQSLFFHTFNHSFSPWRRGQEAAWPLAWAWFSGCSFCSLLWRGLVRRKPMTLTTMAL